MKNLNVYDQVNHAEKQLNAYQQRLATHRYLFGLIISAVILVTFLVSMTLDMTFEIKLPSLAQYQDLVFTYTDGVSCTCSSISNNYGSYLQIYFDIHQVCTSIFVSKKLTETLWETNINMEINRADFRWSGIFFLNALNGFCQITNRTILHNLDRLYFKKYITAAMSTSAVFELQMQSLF